MQPQAHYIPTDTWRQLQAELANAQPFIGDTDLMNAVAFILADHGIVPDYCCNEEGHPYLRRRNFV